MKAPNSPTSTLLQAHTWATLPLAPVLLYQGHRVKNKIIRLQEPDGKREGEAGLGPALRILILGDSSAAGVGVSHQHDALSGHLIHKLANHYRVIWKLEARSGNRTQDAVKQLLELPQQSFDLVIISLGVNDVTAGLSSTAWIQRMQTLIYHLTFRYRTQHILISSLPPMHRFPALPQPLRWYLGNRVKHYNQAMRVLVKQNPTCHFIAWDTAERTESKEDMAEDGFHPGKSIYFLWADIIGDTIHQVLSSKGIEEKHITPSKHKQGM